MPTNAIAFVKSVSRLRKLYSGTRYLYLNMLLMIQSCQYSGGGHLGFMPELSF